MSRTSKLIEKSLQGLCLQYIVDHFDEVIGNRYVRNIGSFDEPVEFLQRRFSLWLLEEMTANRSLKSEHLTFLINPHLRYLDMRSRVFDDPTVLLERLRVVGRTIIRLDLRKTRYEASVMKEIIKLVPYVEELYFSEKLCEGDILKITGTTGRKIRKLVMGYAFLTIEGLRNLCDKNKNGDFEPNLVLKELHIIDVLYDGDDCLRFALKYFPNLEVLDNRGVAEILHEDYRQQIVNGCMENLPKYNLTALKMPDLNYDGLLKRRKRHNKHYDVSEILRVCAVLCPNVETLTAENMTSPDAALACCNFSHLKDVTLVGACKSQPYYHELRALTEQVVVNSAIPIDLFLQGCPNLEKLEFETVKLAKIPDTGEAMAFPKITSLVFHGYNFINDEQGEPILSLIEACSETEELAFPYCRSINNEFIDSLITCKCTKTIRELDFSFSDLNVGYARKLIFSLPCLEKLLVENCDMSWLEYNDLVSSANAEKLAVDVLWRQRPKLEY